MVLIFLVSRSAAAVAGDPDAGSKKVDLPAPDRVSAASAPTGVANQSEVDSVSALALLPEGMPPRVLIRFSGSGDEARRKAAAVAKALTGQRIEVADLRESVVPIRSEISFFYSPDQAYALQVGRLTGIHPKRAALSKDGLMPRPGTVQLSISE